MPQQSILRMGDPRLLRVAQPVDSDSWDSIDELIADMHDTMIAAGGTGIAAPQIGVNLRVVIFEVAAERSEDAEIPLTVLINPVIDVLDATLEAGMEGCLSVPGMRGIVDRHVHITYSGLDQQRNRIHRNAQDFHARVVQHEIDHLDGILYPMRIKDLTLFGYNEEMLCRAG